MDSKRKGQFSDALRDLAAKIDDGTVDVLDASMEAKADITKGSAPGGAWLEPRLNGRFTYDVHVELYIPKSDKAQEDGTWWKSEPSISEVMGRVPWTD